MTLVPPDAEGLAEAAARLREGAIVAYPTETVYGLAVDPRNEVAVQRLINAKGRGAEQAILLVIDGLGQLTRCASEVSPSAQRCIDAFWPGPLTLLFPKAEGLAPSLTGPHPKIAVRCPAHDVARALCTAFGGPITSTSANRTGNPPATCADEVDVPDVALVIDGGVLPPSQPSTLYDPDEERILRQGAIAAEAIAACVRG